MEFSLSKHLVVWMEVCKCYCAMQDFGQVKNESIVGNVFIIYILRACFGWILHNRSHWIVDDTGSCWCFSEINQWGIQVKNGSSSGGRYVMCQLWDSGGGVEHRVSFTASVCECSKLRAGFLESFNFFYLKNKNFILFS